MNKLLCVLFLALCEYTALLAQSKDFRNIENSISIIPDENYSDQPYVVKRNGIIRLLPQVNGLIKSIRIYNRCLTTSEAVSNFHAGVK